MRAAIYARVSTNGHGQDPALQTRELEDYCRTRGWEIAGTYVDNGVSGTREHRPELDRLLQDGHRRKFDVVLVWKLDRFARSLRHLVNALAEFEARGIAFVSLRDNLDLSTPAGRLMFQVIGAMGEFERSLIQERVRAGLRNAMRKGRTLGRPRVSVDLTRIGRLHTQGHSVRAIAAQLGYSRSLVHKSLANHTSLRVANAAD